MKFLLDTCVISEFVKKKPNAAVLAWMGNVPRSDCFLSSITIGEVQKGIERLDLDDARRFNLERWLASIRVQFASSILAFDEESAVVWGRLVGEAIRKGRPKPIADSQIAATALRHGMTLVTRNIRDMADFGVKLFNPFP